MRGPLAWVVWVVVIAGGIALLLGMTAAIGNRDEHGQTVPADAWAQSVCGAIGTWRGEMEGVVNDVRQPPATGTGVEEPQSQTPQGHAASVRSSLETSVRATKTLVTGIDDAGIPNTSHGQEAAKQVSDWTNASVQNLEKAQASLDHQATTIEDAVAQLTSAAGAVTTVLVDGVKTITNVAVLDPELGAAIRNSSTCQQLHEEQSST